MAFGPAALFCTHSVIERYSLEGALLGAVTLPADLTKRFKVTRVVYASSTHLLVLGGVERAIDQRPDAMLLRVSLAAPEATPVGCVRKLGHEVFVSQIAADDHQVVWSTPDALLSASY